ncbi:hypothetical protein PoB_006850300 [Plakobranchus ocellatus]|uniref:Uncharacterized protein n=1 Tax=Plakobranchus ocellatus TaxID=259542 RepID=A0AAV4DCN0_9GAST|nr:hypothetical protein PoB_006850300 [Plakobranchus ocellatus]
MMGVCRMTEFQQKLPVVEGCTAKAIHMHSMLVKYLHFDDHACLVSFSWVRSSLILDADAVTAGHCGKMQVCLDKHFLKGHEYLLPSGMGSPKTHKAGERPLSWYFCTVTLCTETC